MTRKEQNKILDDKIKQIILIIVQYYSSGDLPKYE